MPDFKRFGALCLLSLLFLAPYTFPQDSSTGALRGTVADPSGARVAHVEVVLISPQTGVQRTTTTAGDGTFLFQFLPPGEYVVQITSPGMAPLRREGLQVEVGGELGLALVLRVAGTEQMLTVSGAPPLVETLPSGVSSVLDQRAISELPLNGRRFSDLALLTPGVSQDPRSLTSASNGDLSFGGVRGFQSSYLVDGVDNNNAFFSQARGRYRAPYQFSNEVVQEFRVSSNTYGAELGRSGGAVVNVVTRSGSNYWHGSIFDYYRDGRMNARFPSVGTEVSDRQHQFGFTFGGPIRRNRAFFFAGFDQHIFHVPTVVRFLNGTTTVVPQPADYESSDAALVFAAASQLSQMGGQYSSHLVGNAGFAKVDFVLTPHHYLTGRLSTSRYYGQNNVFFDPASPITYNAVSENGEEQVSTQSAVLSLTSSFGKRATSHLRLQFSRDQQDSTANSGEVLTSIYDVIDGFGRSTILPRQTHEDRAEIAETISIGGHRHQWKFGGDVHQTWIYNFFPSLTGGEYIFDNIQVNPFTFVPRLYGMDITPLRAYAHGVPRYYIQNFGNAISHPDTREYAAFAQDTIRVSAHFAVTLGLRYDLQVLSTAGLVNNPLWPDTGKPPRDTNNFAPRAGFAWTLGDVNPVIVRGGFGIFHTRIPQMYNSAVETDNGLRQTHLFLNNTDYYDRQLMPTYPNPLVACAPNAATCSPPSNLAGHLTSDIAAFSPSFQTPYVIQASFSVERDLGHKLAVGTSYLYVHGVHLIRARDLNLPPPQVLSYPVYDSTGTQFQDTYYNVASFAGWQFVPSFTCPYPPCVNPLVRPVTGVGAINEFESAASSRYHGFTVSARRKMASGLYFRLAYTWAQASDDVQDALVVGRPGTVQNSYAPQLDWGRSVTDQRHRLVASWAYEIKPFDRSHDVLRRFFNDWKAAGIVTMGSGRPVDARILGDANRDDNTYNDRLPGVARNSYTGPDYASTDLRLTRRLYLTERFKLDLSAESFNVFNRNNRRLDITDDGFVNSAGHFVAGDKTIGFNKFPGYYTRSSSFMVPASSYAPRQIQFAARLSF